MRFGRARRSACGAVAVCRPGRPPCELQPGLRTEHSEFAGDGCRSHDFRSDDRCGG